LARGKDLKEGEGVVEVVLEEEGRGGGEERENKQGGRPYNGITLPPQPSEGVVQFRRHKEKNAAKGMRTEGQIKRRPGRLHASLHSSTKAERKSLLLQL